MYPFAARTIMNNAHSAVPNNRGVWNNWGGLENFSKINNRGVGIIGGWRL